MAALNVNSVMNVEAATTVVGARTAASVLFVNDAVDALEKQAHRFLWLDIPTSEPLIEVAS